MLISALRLTSSVTITYYLHKYIHIVARPKSSPNYLLKKLCNLPVVTPLHLSGTPEYMQDLAESREELGRLQCLIERLGASRSGSTGLAPLTSIQAALLKARAG